MKKNIVLVVLLFSIFFLSAKAYQAERYNCQISVRPDGDLHIREVVYYHFSGKPFTWVERLIPDNKTDGLEYVNIAFIDSDGLYSADTGKVSYGDGELQAKWKFAPALDKTLGFELEFIAQKVCYIEKDQLIINWQPLPTDHKFRIREGEVRVVFPRAFETEPQIVPVKNSRVAVHTSQNTITYRFHDFAPNEIFPVTVILEPDALPIEKPDWQRVDEVQNYYGKYLLWLLAFTGVILLLLIFKLIADYKKKMNKYTPDDLPDDLYSLHPVYVSRLVNNFESSSVPFAVIFFLLLKMDAVKIIRRKTNKYEFELKEAEPAEPLEKRFYEVLQEKLAEGKNNLKKLFRQLDKYKKEFNQMIIEKLYELDLADEIMYQRNNRFLVYFLILLFALIIVFVAGLIRFSSGQVTVLFCTFPLAWLLFYFINAAGKIQIHTERGMELKCTWKLWKRLMIRQMKHKPQAVKPEEFDSVFPYTMVMGFSDKYIAFFKKTGVDLSDSELVRSFENVDEFVTFIGWYAAIASASGNSGAAGAAGGGAGGGSASAG